MGEITDIQSVRKNSSRRRAVKNFLILIIIAALIVSAVLMFATPVLQGPRLAIEKLYASLRGGDGFPVETESPVQSLYSSGSVLVCVDEMDIDIFNSNAARLLSLRHGMTRPRLQGAGKLYLLYDKDGSSLYTFSTVRTVSKRVYDDSITDAYLSENGYLAVACTDSRYLGKVIIYNSSNEELLSWYSSECFVMNVSLSDNGKNAAVSCVKSSGGMLCGMVYIFDLTYDRDPVCVSLDDELPLMLDFYHHDLRIVTDRSIICANSSGSVTARVSLPNSGPQQAVPGVSGRIAVLCSDFQGSDSGTVTVYDSSLKAAAKIGVDELPERIFIDRKGIYLYSGGSVDLFSYSGDLAGSAEVGDADAVSVSSSQIYVSNNTNIYQYKIK